METEVKLTKLAACAGCGAKVGAGTLVRMLEGFETHQDPRLIVGYDKSDDASVYAISDTVALVQTTDFFPQAGPEHHVYSGADGGRHRAGDPAGRLRQGL